MQILELKNVAQVLQCHVWTLCTDEYIANVAVEVHPGSDVSHLHVAIKSILTEVCLLQMSFVKIVYYVAGSISRIFLQITIFLM